MRALPLPIPKPFPRLSFLADSGGNVTSPIMRRLELRCVCWGIWRGLGD